MDKHLTNMAKKHFRTRFVKVDVEKAAFLVERLKVQTLPCIIAFEDGISIDRIVGFDELGGTDSFQTSALEQRLEKVLKLTMPTQIKLS
jgi:thioredoxin-like negative regulator of GroEL